MPRKATPEDLIDSFLNKLYYLNAEPCDLIDATSVQLKKDFDLRGTL